MQETSAVDGTPSADIGDTAAALPAQRDTLSQIDTLPPFPQSRTPEPPKKKTLPKVRVPLWLLAGTLFCAGLIIGVLVMRHRAQSAIIIASVNGATITRDDLFNQMQDTVGAQTMHKIIQNDLQLQFAQKKGLAPTDADVDAEYAKMLQRPNFQQALAQSGIPESDFKESLRIQLAETNVITQGVTASEADAQKYYQVQSNPSTPAAQFYQPEEVSLRAIATPSQVLAQRALADLNTQSPFELVATTYSTDASKSNGGLLAPMALGRSPLHADPALEKAVFSMNIGSQIGPVFFAKQWWIFRCQDKAPAKTIPYAQVQEQCLTGAKLVKGTLVNSKRIQQEFTDFQHTSNLQAFWPQYQKVIATH
jgi:foldase protein PrsA